jgi:hypothetical protein
MLRPLKIQKFSPGSGDNGTSTTAGNGVPVPVDIAYPPFIAMDPGTAVTPAGSLITPPWTGVVGGVPNPATSAAYPIVAITVNVALPNGTGAGVAPGAIIRQKGSRKYMVADLTPVAATAMIPGAAYMIATTGNTPWQSFGASVNYNIWDVFTCTAVGTGTGTAYIVGNCVLDDTANPTVGNMSIGFLDDTSTVQYISKLTNKFLFDFAGGEVGGNANAGNVWDFEQVQNNERWIANFFTPDGTMQKSGTPNQANTPDQQNLVPMAQVDKYT